MAALTIENLGKRYAGAASWALRDFSLEVGEGELVAIVGPSGCGKSTLLRILAGLEEETAGTIRLGGRPLNGLAPRDRDLALMFQSYTLLPHLTVEENMGFGLKLRGVPRDERTRRVREAARTLGITPLLARLPSEISGGERQRAALGRAILREPAAFLFDEPLSSLDALMRLQLRVEIQKLHQHAHVPMLFVTHDQGEALTLGDRVVVLDGGSIRQVASPADLYARPANAFVASFIGAPGMNLFGGRVERTGCAARFASPALSLDLTAEQAARVAELEHVTLGVRPERLRRAGQSDALLRGEVTAVERQAGQATLYLRTLSGEASFAARIQDAQDAASFRAGDTLEWRFDEGDVFLFGGPEGIRL
ncbi:MAG TPA: ABC transporter ATP-binding protein [Fibrobacteria bacterium]|nr:ABC transporter ATP-binding protein [Fibrobacteria bacterium]